MAAPAALEAEPGLPGAAVLRAASAEEALRLLLEDIGSRTEFPEAAARAEANLQAARLVVKAAEEDGDPVAVARAALLAQAERVGPTHGAPAPSATGNGHSEALPSGSALRLVLRHGVTPEPATLLAMKELDALPAEVRAALSAVLEAFMAYEDADQAVTAPKDLARVLVKQAALLDAAVRLGEALDAHPTTSSVQGAPLQIAPVLSIDLGPGATVYTQNFLLLIDAGGNDEFRNNGGGNGIYPGSCQAVTARTASALISYGGNDRFISGRDCGTNGGAHYGSGFLFNRAGANTYIGGGRGTNGGGYGLGVGFLLDAGDARTIYQAQDEGTNGGGAEFGMGLLVDGGWNDRYEAGGQGTNGGGTRDGIGLLIDLAGADSYVAEGRGTNGGGHLGGTGLLVDLSGNDDFQAASDGTNGGGVDLGAGLLIALDGEGTVSGLDRGVNGGGAIGGIGVLIGSPADNRYLARDRGVNGGGYVGGVGFLLDLGGDDRYEAGSYGANGGAYASENAPDRVCPRHLAQCVAPPLAFGLLLDRAGTDFYLEQNLHASGADVTLYPKGSLGAQMDL